MKILILLAYYNRPNMIRFALNSIANQTHKDWELAFVDDGSDSPGRPIVEEILSKDIDKVKFYNTNNTREHKESQGGSLLGLYWNEAMVASDADIAIMLCDDDALYVDYLENLNNYYSLNPNVIHSYGHVSIFNPLEYTSVEGIPVNTDIWLNAHTYPINPNCSVDASQVSWRIRPVVDHGARFPFPQTINLDATFYEQLHRLIGLCEYNGLITQYKGWHADQLEYHKSTPYEVKDM